MESPVTILNPRGKGRAFNKEFLWVISDESLSKGNQPIPIYTLS